MGVFENLKKDVEANPGPRQGNGATQEERDAFIFLVEKNFTNSFISEKMGQFFNSDWTINRVRYWKTKYKTGEL